jgi:DNA-binding response OmpR family regulator
VDDEPDITALVAYHLAKASYRVTTAANGRDALRAAREERPDLIVLDLMLPGLGVRGDSRAATAGGDEVRRRHRADGPQ